jgi:membrane-associated protease RseP (regulator of RpoE activity)
VAERHFTDGVDPDLAWPETPTRISAWPRRWWLHLILFVLTFLTTTAFGSVLAENFASWKALNASSLFAGYARLAHLDSSLWSGLCFSVPLLTILLAHEFGHYFACKKWAVEASLPYFLPSPTLLGTFGAFIKIRSPIYTRKILFDIGASGPLAGLVTLIPFLIYGVYLSRLSQTPGGVAEFSFSTPALLWLVERLRFGVASPAMVQLHPMAMAAWAGLLATAVNLLPIGQLDGGHILYSLFGERGHRWFSTGFIGVLVILGFFYWPWWVWAVGMFFLGRRHPLIYDREPLRRRRILLGAAALLMLLLSMSVVPVATR